jgi:hypothetical protein
MERLLRSGSRNPAFLARVRNEEEQTGVDARRNPGSVLRPEASLQLSPGKHNADAFGYTFAA